MEHEWLPEESLNGTLANLFLRSTIIIALRWRDTVSIERNHGYKEMFGYKEI